MNSIPQTLIDQLHHADYTERKAALLALADIDHPDKLALLINALRVEQDPFIREDLTYAVTRFGARSVPALSPPAAQAAANKVVSQLV